METYKVIGVMSGTSLDGLDLAFCEFEKNEKWAFRIIKGQTITYTDSLKTELRDLFHASALEYVKTDKKFGEFIASSIQHFIKVNGFKPDLVASHGHTIFHQPEKGITSQIGDGNVIAAMTGIPVINNFRALDIALGGQGAPLVPVGDRLLFPEYHYCLNLGGIANISMEYNEKRIAWDICPANMILNYLSNKVNHPYDLHGNLAASGRLIPALLDKLNAWDYYYQKTPKSLGREAVETYFFPILANYPGQVHDTLHTFCEHIADQIGGVINTIGGKMLVTGGGAFNRYLISRIREYTKIEVHVPDEILVNFKEAMVFAFLGLLRWKGMINCYASVTGATRDCCCGEVILP